MSLEGTRKDQERRDKSWISSRGVFLSGDGGRFERAHNQIPSTPVNVSHKTLSKT